MYHQLQHISLSALSVKFTQYVIIIVTVINFTTSEDRVSSGLAIWYIICLKRDFCACNFSQKAPTAHFTMNDTMMDILQNTSI